MKKILLLAVLLILCACGGETSSPSTNTTSSVSSETPTSQVSETTSVQSTSSQNISSTGTSVELGWH